MNDNQRRLIKKTFRFSFIPEKFHVSNPVIFALNKELLIEYSRGKGSSRTAGVPLRSWENRLEEESLFKMEEEEEEEESK